MAVELGCSEMKAGERPFQEGILPILGQFRNNKPGDWNEDSEQKGSSFLRIKTNKGIGR
jgi:hypothetical protein